MSVWMRMQVFSGLRSVCLTTFDIDGYSGTGRKCVWRKKREFENTTFSANFAVTNLMIRCVTRAQIIELLFTREWTSEFVNSRLVKYDVSKTDYTRRV